MTASHGKLHVIVPPESSSEVSSSSFTKLTMLLAFVFAAVAAVASNSSTTVATPVFDSGVPTDAPLPGDYTGALRPQIHFSPPTNFMNDPNGCHRDQNGTYHLYYQYNPTDTVAGNQHWGHATSKDLYHWENQQIAIYATEDSQIFSGSAVIDVKNTSGFFPNQTNGVVAIYTLNTVEEQVQEIAYSFDGGYTFTQYAENPVLVSNYTTNQFRDPHVSWFAETSQWVMVIAYAQDFVIGIFTSPDLKTWTHGSNFTHHGLLGLQYECPNLVSIPVDGSLESMFILAISINPGAPLGGSITQYFPGSFNGTHFEPVDGATRIADFGKDNYAGQFFNEVPGNEEQVFIGWASNWQYAQEVPTGQLEGWRSAMTLPRRTKLANVTRTGWDWISTPYDLTPLYETALASESNIGNGSVILDYSTVSSGAVYFQANVSGLATSAQGTLNFTFSASSTRESVSGGMFFGGDAPFWLNRGRVLGFSETNPFFSDKFSVANPINAAATFMVEGVIDRSILEVFLDGGRNSATSTFFPQGTLDTFELRTVGLGEGVSVSVKVWGLRGAWAEMASADGTVYGNVGNATQVARRDYA